MGGGEPQSGLRAEQHGFHARCHQVRVARVDGEDDEVEVPPQQSRRRRLALASHFTVRRIERLEIFSGLTTVITRRPPHVSTGCLQSAQSP